MNQLRNDLPQKIKDFFIKMRNYIDDELYFYGSVTRSDYVPGKSDIDVAIFTDNESSTISKLQHFLHVKRNAFEKLIWKLNGTMIYGYKIKCDKYTDINCEIAIYNNEFKEVLIDEFVKPTQNASIIITILLHIVKLFYYKIPLLPTQTYIYLKRTILNDLMGKKDSIFYLLKNEDTTSNNDNE
jgi:predicted nucleotidyltransferase